MRGESESAIPTRSPFGGLVPSRLALHQTDAAGVRPAATHDTGRVGQGLTRGLAATMPIVLASTMAITAVGLQPQTSSQKPRLAQHPNRADATPTAARSSTPVMTTTSFVRADGSVESASPGESAIPAVYEVQAGDTVADVAGRFGVSTASVLALNGLSWKSMIFAGQMLTLTPAPPKVAATPAHTATAAAKPVAIVRPATRVARYTIASGDTVSGIARRFGVSVQSILIDNRLTASSIIYPGRILVIGATTPTAQGSAAPSTTEPAQVGSATVPLSSSMAANAKTIIGVGRSLGVPSYGIVIALATAAQESHLENLNYGDRDSVGLFQQRPSSGWGTDGQLENPTYASELFYGGPKNPNKGRTRGLLDIPGWQSMSLTQAAQAVQVSAAPNAYAKWETSARAWLAELG